MRIVFLVISVLFVSSLCSQVFNPDNLREEINQWHLDHPIPENDDLEVQPIVPSIPGQQIDRVEHLCHKRFLSGANIAWNKYANDLAGYDAAHFETVFTDIEASGGNSVRFWLHTNGVNSPQFEDNGDPLKCTGFANSDISNLVDLVDRAWNHGIAVQICIWTHNMLYSDAQSGMSQAIRDRNRALIENPIYTQYYIDNALLPMVNALKGNPGVLAYEIYNEPEGMCNNLPHKSPVGWTAERTEMQYIQQSINLMAGAIHRADSGAQVTNGAWDVESTTDVDGHVNYYKDDSLIARGGDPDGYLDFYEVHYYNWAKDAHSPFSHDVSYWQLDKPLVVAEFYSEDTYGVLTDSLFQELYDRGYAGGWAWTYKKYWSDIKPGMEILYANHKDDIDWNMLGCDGVYADFNADNQEPCTNLNVLFTDDSQGDIDSWNWDFGNSATPSTATGKGPHNVVYASTGAKNIQLIVGKASVYDTILKTNYLDVQQGHELSVLASDNQLCDGSIVEFNSSLFPSFNPTALVTGTGTGGFNSTATQTQSYEVFPDGTINPSIADSLSKYLFGSWKSTWGTWVEFTANYGSGGTAYLKAKATSSSQTVESFIDGVSQGTMIMNNTGTFTINVPQGKHVVKFAIITQDWINVEEYGFTNLVPEINYEWHLNNNLLSGETLDSLSLNSLVDGDKVVLKGTSSDFNCAVSEIISNEIEMNCTITGLNKKEEEYQLNVYPNPSNNLITIESEKKLPITILNSMGAIVKSEIFTNQALDVSSWSPGVYFVLVQGYNKKVITKFIKP